MNIEEKAKIVAFVRLLGIEDSDKEIFQRYSNAYENALNTFKNELPKSNPATVKSSPF